MSRGAVWIGVAFAGLLALGCQSREVTNTPASGVVPETPANATVTITGKLLAVKDDRPADGGVDLTVETEAGKQEILRVGSAFIAGPRDAVLALHAVVDAAKVGNRLKASGHRDESGALIVDQLEILD